MELRKSWDKEVQGTEAEIEAMFEKTKAELEKFFQSQGSWSRVMKRWEKRVVKLLENAPVLESNEGEEGMIGNTSVET